MTNTIHARLALTPAAKVLFAVCAALAIFGLHSGTAHAATVWNLSPGSACTIANAIIASNTNAPAGSCAAGSNGGTINLGSGTYTLSASLPEIRNYPLTIKGTGPATTTINGQSLYNVIYDVNSAPLTLQSLTITRAGGGNGYAALLYGPTVSLTDIVISNPAAGGLYFGIGGGGTVNVRGLSVVNAGGGGGISVNIGGGVLNLVNTTLYNNSGGLWVTGNGGGTVTVLNTTIAHNLASGRPGGIAVQRIAAGTTVAIHNTILDGNYDNGVPANCGTSEAVSPGTLVLPTSTGHDVTSDTTCGFSSSSNQTNRSSQLQALTNMSGTLVLPITYASPAFNRGDASGAPTSDQRGIARPQCGAVDIGAYETTACDASQSDDAYGNLGSDDSSNSGGTFTGTSGGGVYSSRDGGVYSSDGTGANGSNGGSGSGSGGDDYVAFQQQAAGAGISEAAENIGRKTGVVAKHVAGNPATWVITTVAIALASAYAGGHGGFWLGRHNRQLRQKRERTATWLHKTRIRLRRYFALPK